jgi:hypothetical protein
MNRGRKAHGFWPLALLDAAAPRSRAGRQGARLGKGGPPMDQIRLVKLELAHQRSARATLSDVVREFAPNWFTVTMGTGAVALALNQFPLPISGAYEVAGGLWLLDIVLFVLFTVFYAARWILFFDGARQIFGHSVASMFLGAIPMGLATIINGLLIFGLPLWGKPALCIAHALWCQSASKFDPRSASNFDPLERRVRAVALAPSELVRVAETARARVVG